MDQPGMETRTFRKDDLPSELPLFPLGGTVLMPHGFLPLTIFEPRYVSMLRDAVNGRRLIGIAQPLENNLGQGHSPIGGGSHIYQTGTAGHITRLKRTEDKRYLITLQGICRFDLVEELPLQNGYRRAVVDYSAYLADLEPVTGEIGPRERLWHHAMIYLRQKKISLSWEDMTEIADEDFLNIIVTVAPFASNEKQVLLEADNLAERARLLMHLLETGILSEEKKPSYLN